MSGKIGEGHVSAMARLGLRELRAATYPNSNVAQSQEYGLYGTKTPGEVAEDRRDDGHNLDEESAAVVTNEKEGKSIFAGRLGVGSGKSEGKVWEGPDLER